MVLVYQNYTSDLGRAYPMFALSVSQVNDVDSNINPVDLLPDAIRLLMMRVRVSCRVEGLTPRTLSLWTTDGAQFLVTYPQPFSETLADYLTLHPSIQAWEFIGEKTKYGRLRRMLDNVQP